MKKLIFAVGFGVLLLSLNSCKKSSSIAANADATIVGEWELSLSSGMGGVMPFAAGNGNTWKFTSNRFYQYLNDTLADQGTYNIVNANTVPNAISGGYLNLEGNTTRKYPFYLTTNTTLNIDFGSAVDAPIDTYTKK